MSPPTPRQSRSRHDRHLKRRPALPPPPPFEDWFQDHGGAPADFIRVHLPPTSQILELAARIEPDGGMPGRDEEQRWLASALALARFMTYQVIGGTTALAASIRRLVQFLNNSPYLQGKYHGMVWLERVEKGERGLRDPAAEVSRLLAGEIISTEAFKARCAPVAI